MLAITLHNIPEGLAVGIAFGALANGGTEGSLAGALTLALGIGIQNFPEGVAVSMPLRGEGMSEEKASSTDNFRVWSNRLLRSLVH